MSSNFLLEQMDSLPGLGDDIFERHSEQALEDLDAPTSQGSKFQTIWGAVKQRLPKRSSFHKILRRLSNSSTTEPSEELKPSEQPDRSADAEEGLFCDALLGLAERADKL